MSEQSAIEWTEATWNPWMGCTKVSPGCAHCYMFREQRQYGQDPELVRRSKTKFADPLKWPEPRTIFTCSWSDWFHEAADEWRDEAWDIVRRTPQHTYQILTKRPERIVSQLPADWDEGYPNVWLGVSVESWRYSFRASWLCDIPAQVRFISAEPLLGRLDLTECKATDRPGVEKLWERRNVLSWNNTGNTYQKKPDGGRIHWVIAGGESGPDWRATDETWLRSLRDQCARYDVPFFLKQLGGPTTNKRGGEKALLDGKRWTDMPKGTNIRTDAR